MNDFNGINKATFDSLGVKRAEESIENSKPLEQSDFLKLLNKQLDESNPLVARVKSGANSSSGVEQTNSSQIFNLHTSLQSNQALQASTLVGKRVLVPCQKFVVEAEMSYKFKAILAQPTKNLSASLVDSMNTVLKDINLGDHQKGLVSFEWNNNEQEPSMHGKDCYITLTGELSNGLRQELPLFIASNINSITLGRVGEEMLVNVSGLGDVKLKDVLQVDS